MSRIRSVQIERRKLADKVVGSLPNLDVRIVCHGNERSIGRKFDGVDWLFEVEMVNDDTPAEVDEQSSSVCVVVGNEWTWWKTDEVLTAPSSTLIKMFPCGLRAMAAIFLRFWKAKVKDLLLCNGFVS